MNTGSFSPLISEIKAEKDHLQALVAELEEVLDGIDEEPTSVELRATGSILHDYYTGLEKIFRLIALEVDGDLPSGSDWHKRLLDRMAAEIEEARPPAINKSLKEKLGEYLRFRHLFRHIYGFELNWNQCTPLAKNLKSLHKEIEEKLEELEEFLRKIDQTY